MDTPARIRAVFGALCHAVILSHVLDTLTHVLVATRAVLVVVRVTLRRVAVTPLVLCPRYSCVV